MGDGISSAFSVPRIGARFGARFREVRAYRSQIILIRMLFFVIQSPPHFQTKQIDHISADLCWILEIRLTSTYMLSVPPNALASISPLNSLCFRHMFNNVLWDTIQIQKKSYLYALFCNPTITIFLRQNKLTRFPQNFTETYKFCWPVHTRSVSFLKCVIQPPPHFQTKQTDTISANCCWNWKILLACTYIHTW